MLPVVKIMAASSDCCVGGGVYVADGVLLNCWSVGLGRKPNVGPTVTLNRAAGNLRLMAIRTAWAAGIATNPSGFVSCRHLRMFLRPMPGSIRTTTAPTLRSAKTKLIKSGPNLTSMTIRMPGLTPICCRPAAMEDVWISSSANVIVLYSRSTPAWKRSTAIAIATSAGRADATWRNRNATFALSGLSTPSLISQSIQF